MASDGIRNKMRKKIFIQSFATKGRILMEIEKKLVKKALIIAFLPLLVIVFLILPRGIQPIALKIFTIFAVLFAFILIYKIVMGHVNSLRRRKL